MDEKDFDKVAEDVLKLKQGYNKDISERDERIKGLEKTVQEKNEETEELSEKLEASEQKNEDLEQMLAKTQEEYRRREEKEEIEKGIARIEVDKKGNITDINKVVTTRLGYDKTDLKGKAASIICENPEDLNCLALFPTMDKFELGGGYKTIKTAGKDGTAEEYDANIMISYKEGKYAGVSILLESVESNGFVDFFKNIFSWGKKDRITDKAPEKLDEDYKKVLSGYFFDLVVGNKKEFYCNLNKAEKAEEGCVNYLVMMATMREKMGYKIKVVKASDEMHNYLRGRGFPKDCID
ncbi:hypothetical protein KY332_03825 [Candidatus Woesearchaeota archaeon]|nr:hypothetical protein [Candidatus Woesearchaeota archaeon]